MQHRNPLPSEHSSHSGRVRERKIEQGCRTSRITRGRRVVFGVPTLCLQTCRSACDRLRIAKAQCSWGCFARKNQGLQGLKTARRSGAAGPPPTCFFLLFLSFAILQAPLFSAAIRQTLLPVSPWNPPSNVPSSSLAKQPCSPPLAVAAPLRPETSHLKSERVTPLVNAGTQVRAREKTENIRSFF